MYSSFRVRSRLAVAAALTVTSVAAVAAPPASSVKTGSYQEVARYSIGSDGGWDYASCDSAGHRLFIARGSHVQVVSTDTGKLIGDIPNTKGCHGVALAPELGRGFVSDGGDNQITIFDLKTLKTTGTVSVGMQPDAILYDPATKRIFTFNTGSSDTTVLNAASGKVVGTIPLGGKPEFAQSDGAGMVFVNIEDKSELLTLDAKALKVLRRTSLAPAEEPSGLALDKKRHLLFAACGNEKAAVVDSQTGKLVATPPIGSGPDAAAVDAASGTAFMSNGEGTLSILRESKTAHGTFTTETISTAPGARTMTIDPATHRLYLITAQFAAPSADAPANGRRPRAVPNSFMLLVFAPSS